MHFAARTGLAKPRVDCDEFCAVRNGGTNIFRGVNIRVRRARQHAAPVLRGRRAGDSYNFV